MFYIFDNTFHDYMQGCGYFFSPVSLIKQLWPFVDLSSISAYDHKNAQLLG